jgi:cobalt-zinc-cadmium efflux system membrane fusion protein
VFEIVDPKRLRVEALAYDADTAGDVAGASLAVGEQRVIPLDFLGAARSLREQALPLAFVAAGDSLARFLPSGNRSRCSCRRAARSRA